MLKTTGAIRSQVILAAIVLARIGWGFQFQTVGSLGPRLIALFHLDYTTFGNLIGAFLVAGTFAALPLGVAGSWLGDRVVMAGGLALMVAGAVVSAAGGGPDGIALGRLIAGIGAVGMVVIQGKVIADYFTGRRFLLATGASVAAYPIGVGLAQVVQPPLAGAFGWPAAFLAGGIIQIAALILFLASFRPAPRTSTVALRLALPTARECLLSVIAGTVWASYTAGYTGFLSYTPSLMASRGEGLAMTSTVIAITTWGTLLPTLLGAGLAGRHGPFRIFLLGTTALTIGVGGTAMLNWPLLWAVMLGIIGQIQPGVIQAVGTLSAEANHRAAAMGLYYTVYYAAGAVVPTLCGYAADRAGGPAGALMVAAAVCAVGIPAYALHRRLGTSATLLART